MRSRKKSGPLLRGAVEGGVRAALLVRLVRADRVLAVVENQDLAAPAFFFLAQRCIGNAKKHSKFQIEFSLNSGNASDRSSFSTNKISPERANSEIENAGKISLFS